MQVFTLTSITDTEKTKLRRKNYQSQWTMKYKSRSAGQGACLKGMSRTITMQGFTLLALTDVEKTKLDVNVDGRRYGRTNTRSEIWTPISQPSISRCDKNEQFFSYNALCLTLNKQYS